MISEEFTQWVDYEGLELELDATYSPAIRGQKGDFGQPAEPDTPAQYELNVVHLMTTADGNIDITALLRQNVLNDLEEKLLFPDL